MDKGTRVGLEVVENSSPQFSGRQIGVGQSFSQIMGFLDKGRDAAREARASLCPARGCFSEVQQWVESWTGNHQQPPEDPGTCWAQKLPRTKMRLVMGDAETQ